MGTRKRARSHASLDILATAPWWCACPLMPRRFSGDIIKPQNGGQGRFPAPPRGSRNIFLVRKNLAHHGTADHRPKGRAQPDEIFRSSSVHGAACRDTVCHARCVPGQSTTPTKPNENHSGHTHHHPKVAAKAQHTALPLTLPESSRARSASSATLCLSVTRATMPGASSSSSLAPGPGELGAAPPPPMVATTKRSSAFSGPSASHLAPFCSSSLRTHEANVGYLTPHLKSQTL